MKAIILAAGRSTRFNSDLTKVMHDLEDLKILRRVVDTVEAAGFTDITFVVGHQKEIVTAEFGEGYSYIVQDEQLGTGHAVSVCKGKIEGDNIFVFYGDKPLFSPETISAFVDHHYNHQHNVMTCATVEVPEVTKYSEGYGTVTRDRHGRVTCLEKRVDTKECDGALYAFDAKWLWKNITRLPERYFPHKGHSEYYLTDMVTLAVADGYPIVDFKIENWREAIGINNREQFAQAEAVLKGEL